MDPVTHSLTGAALSAAGLRRTTPLATATLVLGANAPDIDVLSYFAGPYAALAWRRGLTHGPPGILTTAALVAGVILLYDVAIRRRQRPGRPPASATAVLALAVLGAATHPALDWLNNYGVRLFMPFDQAWYYGDAVFIIDPWIWLLLGGAAFLTWSRRPAAISAWAALAATMTLLLWTAPGLPRAGPWIWSAGVLGWIAWRAYRPPAAHPESAVRWALAASISYLLLMVILAFAAPADVSRTLDRMDEDRAEAIMVAPVPANPFAGQVLVATADAYRLGSFHWLRSPRLRLDGRVVPTPRDDAVTRAASRTPEAAHYLTWARFPYLLTEATAWGFRVRIGDARYHDLERQAGSLGGLIVYLDRELRPIPEPPEGVEPR